jgi:hypothetical protein
MLVPASDEEDMERGLEGRDIPACDCVMVLTVGHNLSHSLQRFFRQFISFPSFCKTSENLQLPRALQQSCKIFQGTSDMCCNRRLSLAPAA